MIITIMSWLLSVAILACIVRLFRGPTVADRIVAIELLTGLVVALIALAGWNAYGLLALDVALGLALVGFLGSVGLALAPQEGAKRSQAQSSTAPRGEHTP